MVPDELLPALAWAREALSLGPADRLALTLPAAHPLRRFDELAALEAGARVVLPPSSSAASIVSWLREEAITVVHLVPAQAAAWSAEADTGTLPALRHVLVSSEPIADPVVERWRALAPEAVVWTMDHYVDMPHSAGRLGRPSRSGIHPLGTALAGIALAVVGPEGEALGPHAAGELVVDHPLRGRVHTGLRARLLRGGRIEPLVGGGDPSLDAQEIGEIEVALLRVARVLGAAVVRPAGEPEGSLALTAFVAGHVAPSAFREPLGELLRDELEAMPIVVLPALPTLADGRIDRAALRESAALATRGRRDLTAESGQLAGPRTETEAAVAELWRRLLGASVGVDDDFFLAGGQSLLAAQLAARLSAQLGVDMPLSVFFQLTTVAGQAAWIDRARSGRPAAVEPPPKELGAPLTFAQEQMLLFEQLSPGTTVHHLHWLFRLEGQLDAELLEAAIRAIEGRHEALRTVVRYEGQRPTQQVRLTQRRLHESHDLRSLGPRAEEAALHHAEAAFAQPFDLERGPLFRTALFRVGPSSHLLSFQVHHLIIDAWSLNLWMSELGELYAAALAQRAPVLPSLAVQPIELARAEREATSSGARKAEIAFWQHRLKDLPAGIDLPADHPRPKQSSYRGHFVPFTVPRAVSAALGAHAQSRGATLFMALLAALDLLLTRLSGQSDLVVGTPVGGRDHEATRALIGLFLNNVAIRVDTSGDPTFTELVDRCRDASRAAFAHAALPFERVVAEVITARTPERHPIFDVMLNLIPEVVGLRLPGLSITTVPGHNEASPLDLLVSFRELDDGSLAADLRCSADLFSEESATRLTRQLERVLGAVAGAPETRLSRVPLLDEAERRALIERWNDTEDKGIEGPRASVAARFEAAVDARPEAPAVIAAGGRLSFRELDRRANRHARLLLRRGLPREAHVALFLRRDLDLPAALLGVLKAGCAFVLLDPALPPARARAMLLAARPAALVSQRSLKAELPEELRSRAIFADDPGALDDVEDTRPDLQIEPDQLAYLMFTSGSTGVPKGVLVPHRGLENRLHWVRTLFPFQPGEVVCQKTALGFIDAIWEILGPLCDGIPLVLPPDEALLDPARLAEALERAEVTRIMLVPSLLRALLHHQGGRPGFLPKLTLWLVGGEELRPDLARELWAARPDARIVNLYGSSEVTGEATFHELDPREAGRVPLGLPGPNVRAYVLDAEGEPAPIGVFGELCIGGAGVARGYLDDPAQTALRFVPDPFHPDARMFRTGDRVRRLPSGALDFAGRLDLQLKVQGVRVDPAEVEEALRAHEAILDAAVLLDRGEARGDRLVAYVVARDRSRCPRPSELRAHLRRLLPEPMVPSVLMLLDALPLSPHGKLDRDALPPAVEASGGDPREQTATERALAELWEALLASGPYGPDDDFFARGGYSLLLGQLALRIRAAFDVEVPLGALFHDPSLAGQAAQIDEARRRGDASRRVERVPRTARMPLSFAQERLWLSENVKLDAMPHVVPVALRLRGPLDPDRLERAIDAVAARHEPLRTTFSSELGVPFQTIFDALPRLHERVDLTHLAPSAREAEVQHRQEREQTMRFDLVRGPPFRSSLLRLGPAEHVLLVTMSHLVSDAASIQCWLDEVAALYLAPSPAEARLPELSIQVVDLAVWQRQRLASGELDADRAYFREALGHAPPAPPELPADGRRGPGDSGAWLAAELPSATLLRLRELARERATTLVSVLLTCLGTLVHELTHHPVVTLGVLSAGRDTREAEPLIGLFLNALPVRFHAGGSLRETLGRAHEALMGALAHGAVPFERIVSDVNAPRIPRRNPLFDVVLNYLPASEGVRFGEVELSPLDPPPRIPGPFDLMCRVIQRRDGLHLRLEYRRGLFSEARARGFLDRLLGLIEQAASEGAPS